MEANILAILVGSSKISLCDLNKVLATVINSNTLKNKKKNCLLEKKVSSVDLFTLSLIYFAKQDSSDSLLVVNPSMTLKPIHYIMLIILSFFFFFLLFLLLKISGRTEKKRTTPKVGKNPATI